jgi:hypothetical protein
MARSRDLELALEKGSMEALRATGIGEGFIEVKS